MNLSMIVISFESPFYHHSVAFLVIGFMPWGSTLAIERNPLTNSNALSLPLWCACQRGFFSSMRFSAQSWMNHRFFQISAGDDKVYLWCNCAWTYVTSNSPSASTCMRQLRMVLSATACNDTHRRGLMGYHPVVYLAYKMSPTGLTSFLGIKRSWCNCGRNRGATRNLTWYTPVTLLDLT